MTLYSNYWMLASFSLTVLSAPLWPWMPEWDFAFICLAALMTTLVVSRFRVFGGIALALLVIVTHGNVVRSQSNTIFQAGQDITIKGEVDSFFKQISYGYEGTVVVRSINGQQLHTFWQPKVRLIAPVDLQIGDQFEFSVMVKPVYGRRNEAGFDLEAYYFSQGWVARVNVKPQSKFEVVSTPNFRSMLYRQIKTWTQNSPSQGMILALTFGDRNGIHEAEWRLLRNSGLIHLVAISGLHIGMAFAIGYLIGTAMMRLHVSLLWMPFVSGMCIAAIYAWLAGFTLPTQRALLMCGLNVALTMSGMRVTAVQRILITLAAVLIVTPFAPLSNSFWLSFLAVALVLYQLADRTTRHGWRKWLTVQCSLVTMMIPVSAYFFSGFSVSSALYNLIFIPYFSFVIVPLLFLALFLTTFVGDITWLWRGIDLSFWPLQRALEWSGSSWIAVSQTATVVFSVGLLLWICRPVLSWRAQLYAGIALLGFGFFTPHDERWRVDILDVGHGLAVLIERNHNALLYDTGISWPEGSYVRSLIVPILNQRGMDSLDGLILSHTDNDHAGGLKDAETLLSPKWVVASQSGPNWQACHAGEQWEWQGLTMTALWPPQTVNRAYNLQSCVIRLSDPEYGHSLLLAGDVTAVGEWLLSRQPMDIQSDVIIVPHHGSKTSSTRQFIERVSPQVAIASLAKGNQWQLPHRSVVARYVDAGSHWLDTGEAGQITLTYQAQSRQLSTLRHIGNPSWYRQMLRKGVE
ncbi:DNA internalization-related competence protein ComEC/Rec2 [Vibrio fluvialis]|uniref:DNA internalization-related competence protein ComEC/Rec2 n=1 Tax=Vibrio fluvialis TaxID=676 RepID=UPI001EECB6B6|nr:DNA internalization-related competence protein ComEC/Rec2 [Vibrio fluvialis]ELS8947085.1 DNA internalization-related competence protein ComEC/Rec2 [Vibrio fluvialis]MCG6385631.1 DNA internalization-related competence protein ComEC/Rec2 [Vibrio fluvialis]